ncbi:LysR family transcriptional regulator [Kineosporia succinea]|uniref:DNA-binding transcriptional LysR family regulator n=1 Tax=Kineosporia succinea TaxID=84632 RepID=A0ABT9P8Q4_9ACTN|nr:LysR family transcriptional regulator [Kineosporia succinea]MDP9828931.1 DNA-binding transcriptional LysR family regulator [Kineosporia succinea]
MARKPDITLAQLRYFVEAASCLSMTQAATSLLVAQSAVSSAVAQLESQVGAQLFIRMRSKGLALTPAGQQLLGDARAVLGTLDEALDAARGMDEQVRGTIRIAFFVTLAPFLLADVMALLAERHPGLDVDVIEVDADEAREALRSGRAEMAVSWDFAFGEEMRREIVTTVPPHVVLPAGHPLSARRRVPLRELAHDKMILLDLPHSREYFLDVMRGAGVEPVVRHRSYGYETVRSLVAKGYGYAILNQQPRHDSTYDGRAVVTRPISDEVPGLPLVVATLRSVRATARVRAVADAVRVVANAVPGARPHPGT